MNLFSLILNSILPPRCIKCGKILSEKNGLCADCFKQITFISEPYCQCCGKPLPPDLHNRPATGMICGQCLKEKRRMFKLQRAAFIYDDKAKDLIVDFKFRDKTISAETLANMMFRAGHDIWAENPDILMPVPMHRLRLLKRKYNQAALLTKKLSEITQISADYTALVRTENTIPQVLLSGSARRNNLKHAFRVNNPQAVFGKKIVLVDDVKTTGSTLRECAKVLRKAGAAEIFAITAAQTDK